MTMLMLHVKKANSVLSFLRRNLKHYNRRVKIDAYNSFARPILNYAAPVWAPHANYHINKIESIQKGAARFVMSDFRRTSGISTKLTTLQWRPVEIQHKELWLIMLFKIIHGLVELRLPDYIIPAPRITRGHTIKFIQPAMYTDSYKYSFYPNSINYWYKLPPQLANNENLNNFFTLLRSHL